MHIKMKMPWYQKPIAEINEPEGFGVLGEKYFEHLAVSNFSERTIEGKRRTLKLFADWCEIRDISRPEEITLALAERYQKHWHYHRKENGKPLSIGSQRQRVTAVKMFYQWLVKAGYLNNSPLEMIELPKMPQQLPKAILSEKEIEKVLAQPDLGCATGLRDRAMMETLYSTGIRRMECLDLKLNSVDRYRGLIRINLGKGQKDRIIPIGNRALFWIERYLVDSRPELIKSVAEDTLFISQQGKRFHETTITAKFGEYIKQAGIDKSGSVHIFRHSAATLMLENGADIRHIQAMLGHADLSTTQIYTHVAITKLKEVHDKTHPAKFDERYDDD